MKQVDRTKVCWSCEADVSYQATYCPFCGTDLLTSSIEPNKSATPSHDDKFTNQNLKESLASLYKPPYSVRNRQGLGVPDEREERPLHEHEEEHENPLFQPYEQMELKDQHPVIHEEERGENVVNKERGNIFPLLCLMIGTHLLILGSLLLFCSNNGFVTLQWSSRLWFLYCLISFPLIYIGCRILKKQSS